MDDSLRDEAKHTLPLVYQDLGRPAARELGGALGRTMHLVTSPVRAVLWSFEQIEEYLTRRADEYLKGIPDDRVHAPPPEMLPPIFYGMASVGDDVLRDMFAALLAAGMTDDLSGKAHPAFADIIRQLSPQEARSLRAIAQPSIMRLPAVISSTQVSGGGQLSDRVEEVSWPNELGDIDEGAEILGSLRRLGLVEVLRLKGETASISEGVVQSVDGTVQDRRKTTRTRATIEVRLTTFGRRFAAACVRDHD